MAVKDVEAATLSPAAIQERQTVGGEAITGKFIGNTVSVVKQSVNVNGRVVDVEIGVVDRVNHQEKGRPVDKQYTLARNSVVARLNLTKWAQATVISYLPIELRSDSCLDPLRDARVPAVRDGEPFSFLIFKNPHLEAARVGPDAPLACFDFQPIMLAMEFQKIYEPQGGVIAFIGSPDDVDKPNWEHKEAWEAAKKRAIAHMESMYREARQYWDQKLHYAVREVHRACIRRLYHLGYIKELPNELDKQRDVAVEYPVCGKCQQRQDSPHAIQCQRPGCGWIIDPARAYTNNVIAEDDPALERLTRDQVKELGISMYVAETSDEKPVRLSMGLQKPKSEAVMNHLEEMARLQEAEEARKSKNQQS